MQFVIYEACYASMLSKSYNWMATHHFLHDYYGIRTWVAQIWLSIHKNNHKESSRNTEPLECKNLKPDSRLSIQTITRMRSPSRVNLVHIYTTHLHRGSRGCLSSPTFYSCPISPYKVVLEIYWALPLFNS